jgi:hypothetical protein
MDMGSSYLIVVLPPLRQVDQQRTKAHRVPARLRTRLTPLRGGPTSAGDVVGCRRSGLSLGRGGERVDRALCFSVGRNRPPWRARWAARRGLAGLMSYWFRFYPSRRVRVHKAKAFGNYTAPSIGGRLLIGRTRASTGRWRNEWIIPTYSNPSRDSFSTFSVWSAIDMKVCPACRT